MDLLRKKDLHGKLSLAKSTVADWINEFQVYIPTVKEGNMVYYKPEALDVLNFIRECREKNYSKPQIMTLLAEKGFPITVEEAVEEVQHIFDSGNYRDTLLTVMQTTGQALVQLTKQDEAIQKLENKQDEQDGRITELEEHAKEIEFLKKQLNDLKQELAAAKEEQNKGFFKRLFNR